MIIKTTLLLAVCLSITSCGYDPSARSTVLDSVKIEGSWQSEDGMKNANVTIQPFK